MFVTSQASLPRILLILFPRLSYSKSRLNDQAKIAKWFEKWLKCSNPLRGNDLTSGVADLPNSVTQKSE